MTTQKLSDLWILKYANEELFSTSYIWSLRLISFNSFSWSVSENKMSNQLLVMIPNPQTNKGSKEEDELQEKMLKVSSFFKSHFVVNLTFTLIPCKRNSTGNKGSRKEGRKRRKRGRAPSQNYYVCSISFQLSFLFIAPVICFHSASYLCYVLLELRLSFT